MPLVQYMDHTHPDAFVDFEKLEPMVNTGYTKPCPVCQCYGGWNLKLNAYPLHNYPNTAENRHRYSHFRSNCSHCNGYGYTLPTETCSGHEWERKQNLGRCYTLYVCKKCNKNMEVDSSD
jgi:hypothetical protein